MCQVSDLRPDDNHEEEGEVNNCTTTSSTTPTTTKQPLNDTWTYWTEGILHPLIRRGVVSLSTRAARNPKACIVLTMLLSFVLIVTGFLTNFRLVLNHEEFFAPMNSLPEQHAHWIRDNKSGFPLVRPFLILLHQHGDNVVNDTETSLRYLFQVYQTVVETPGYAEVCRQGDCQVSSATQFWNHDWSVLEQDLEDTADLNFYLQTKLANTTFPDGTPVFTEAILGNYQITNNISTHTKRISFAQSLIIKIDIPDLGDVTDQLEEQLLDRLGTLRDKWQSANEIMALEYFTMYAYQLEFERAIYSDIPLVVIMMTIMVGFCCLVFYDRHNAVQSRSLMGFFSIATIGMSLMTGYGLVWIIGVPFTNIAMMVPFIVVGVGLDDTFIITGAYVRRRRQRQQLQVNTDEDIVKCIQDTMEEVGLSITLTTTTTVVAFALGSISSIPAIRWLCIYGFVTIAVDFFYQITYFVAWLVLDERRVQANKKDCCIWITVEEEGEGEQHTNDDNEITATHTTTTQSHQTQSTGFSERFMCWYADQLLKPAIKAIVLFVFVAYLGGCIYFTTQLTQEFRVQDYVPKDSHVDPFFQNFEAYSTLFRQIGVYFRHVNQSDPMVQQQMLTYVEELSQLEQIGGPPELFWVRDFADMATSPQFAEQTADLNLENKTFQEQIDLALQIPQVQQGYGNDIVRDPDTGDIVASRCFIGLRKIDMDSIPNQIDMLMDQRAISAAQPINQGTDEWSFFTFDDLYFYWELYAVSVEELIFTTITGVCAVSAVAFLLIPHWSAVAFVTPLIICLYFLLLGTMQYCGIHVNAVTYVIIVMAIGLLVDFLMHIMLRYYETTGTTRHAKVKETLRTMGASIMLGGLTTFLGVIPLAFSTTTIFMTVFISFLAMVSLGCGIGLIVLPVLLSLFGPVATTHLPADNSHTANKEVGSNFETSHQLTTLSNGSVDDTREQSEPSSASDGEDNRNNNSQATMNQESSADCPRDDGSSLGLVMSSSQGGGYEAIIEV